MVDVWVLANTKRLTERPEEALPRTTLFRTPADSSANGGYDREPLYVRLARTLVRLARVKRAAQQTKHVLLYTGQETRENGVYACLQ